MGGVGPRAGRHPRGGTITHLRRSTGQRRRRGVGPQQRAVSWEYRFDESGPGPIILTSELVWVGGDEDELVGFTPDSGTVNQQYQADSAIVSLAADRDTLFLGTYLDGLFALDAGG